MSGDGSLGALEVAMRAEKRWLRDNCSQCGRPYPTTADWAAAPDGSRSDLCWEPDGTCLWRFSSINPDALRLSAILAAERERIAQAVEADKTHDVTRNATLATAARIARTPPP